MFDDDATRNLTDDDRRALHVAAVVGVEALAAEIRRLGLAAEGEDPEAVAERARGDLLQAHEAIGEGRDPVEHAWMRVSDKVVKKTGFPSRLAPLGEMAEALADSLNADDLFGPSGAGRAVTAEDVMVVAETIREGWGALLLIEGEDWDEPKEHDDG